MCAIEARCDRVRKQADNRQCNPAEGYITRSKEAEVRTPARLIRVYLERRR